ncbi:ABC transporter ATP-binding protein [Arthrobacter sp. B10-11]|uniref:ABC transporter ATP-binding protein n=1 Tax=Arthrobacter sp. B10-11 TaxID=3081160 RepID=UPI0029555E3D|nr:ATP-binding cassette domain-containing protein [Arthrobacter sp. B10-11]MDV8149761.1 ATP-binding cassette domain-containing protein [Arthrobacter sp. B10-11]
MSIDHGVVLIARNLSHSYRGHLGPGQRGLGARRRVRPALNDVSLAVPSGSSIGLVGSSGAGKSTLLRTLLALEKPGNGTVEIAGCPVRPGSASSLRWYRRLVQYVPQNPAGSLDPRMNVEDLLTEPLRQLCVDGHHAVMIRTALERVGLDDSLLRRRPAELSGGQNQRVAIARALVPAPQILLADEPVSGLDLPLRNSALSLLRELVHRDGLGLLFVSHDLSAVAGLCSRTVVLAAGRIVEQGPTRELFSAPQHPCTRELIESIPGPVRTLETA